MSDEPKGPTVDKEELPEHLHFMLQDPNEDDEGQDQASPPQAAQSENDLDRAHRGLRADLVRARQRAREAEERAAKIEGYNEALRQQFASYEQHAAEQYQPPDKEEDPVGHLEYTTHANASRLEEKLTRLEQLQQQQVQGQMAQQQQQAVARLAAAQKEWAETQLEGGLDDYVQALNHAREKTLPIRSQYHLARGANPDDLPNILQQEETMWAMQQLHSGKNPAQAAYELAQYYGYQPQQRQSAPQPAQASAQPQMATRRTRSLSATPGSASTRGLTVDDALALADSDPQEFSKLAADPDKWRQLMTKGSI